MKSKLDHARYIQCRLSASFMAGLSAFWAILSFFALRWLGPLSRWEAFGPMEWLCTMLLLIHVILIAATFWIWRHPKPELLVLGLPRESARGFGAGFLVGMAGIWFAARSTGWLQAFALLVSVSALIVDVVSMSRELRAARRLEQRVLGERNDESE
jgi:hypothetical protein